MPERVSVPGAALTVSRLAPLMLPDNLAAIALKVREVLPVLVKVCNLYPVAVTVPTVSEPPVAASPPR